jgi:hypothetical protein
MNFSDCLSKCYIIILHLNYELFRLFIGMLHRCFALELWTSQIVYVNVTSLFWIHIMKFSDCLCKCYIIILHLNYELLRLFIQMLHPWKFSDCLCKCYIIILHLNYEILRLFIQMLHPWKFSDCLCKCYIIILHLNYQLLRLFI